MKRLLTNTALLALVIGVGAQLAEGVVPTTANVTLHGSDEAGPLEGSVEVTVRIYDAADGGTMIFEETHNTTAADGLMYLELGGAGGGALDATVFDGGDRWVELGVNGTTMSPRLKVGVVPYAVAAGSADTVGDLRPEDLAPSDHDHAGDYLPLGSTLDCPGGVVVGLDSGTGDVVCGAAGAEYGAAAGGGLALDANNDFSIAAGGVTNAHIAAGAVDSAAVADNSLTANDLAANSVTASEIAPSAVGSSEVIDDSLTFIDLAPNSVTASEISTNAVGASEIAANAVGASEIATGAVGNIDRTWGDSGPLRVTNCGNFRAARVCPAGDAAGSCGGDMIDCDEGPVPGGYCEYDSGCTALPGQTGLSASLNNCGDCEIYIRMR